MQFLDYKKCWHDNYRQGNNTTRQNLLFIPLRPTRYYYYYDNMSTTNDDSGPNPEALDPSELQLARNDRGGNTRVMSPRQNEGLLIGLAGQCQRCEEAMHEPIMCT